MWTVHIIRDIFLIMPRTLQSGPNQIQITGTCAAAIFVLEEFLRRLQLIFTLLFLIDLHVNKIGRYQFWWFCICIRSYEIIFQYIMYVLLRTVVVMCKLWWCLHFSISNWSIFIISLSALWCSWLGWFNSLTIFVLVVNICPCSNHNSWFMYYQCGLFI